MRKKSSDLTAYQQALGLLVRREHSRRELKRKLKERGKEHEEIDLALDNLSRQDLARSRQSAGYGPQRIRAELYQHSLESEYIDQAISALNCDWLELAQDLVARRYLRKMKQDPNQTQKAVAFLLRRGFDQKTAFTAVKVRECPESEQFIK